MADTKQRTAQNPSTASSGETPAFKAVTPSKEHEIISVKIEAGNRAFLEKKYPDALRIYEEALKLAPDDLRLMGKVAAALYKLRDFSRSIEQFKKILEINPRDKDAIYNLGLVYSKSKDKMNALSMYDKLKKIHAEKAESLYKIIYE